MLDTKLKFKACRERLVACEATEADATIHPTTVEPLSWTICCPEFGWIDARLRIGQDVFPITFSDVYPPFLDLVDWITRIAEDQDPDPVWVDDEFRDHFFAVSKTTARDGLLFEYARFLFDGTGLYRKALVNKDDLVREFYLIFKYLMEIDLAGEDEKPEGTAIYFNFGRNTDEILRFDLSAIESYLNAIDTGTSDPLSPD
ncbi:hypothetical protein [Thiococcus pfennigii]|uniref:hypothetical protein n=1 Tax=Thiococcus pfennigii TaxID=1057 RepID=UPI0019065496|nr:hypothetical protein [Thiococcus pfennigii]MBK1730906.1 hypothetical protein [Thiococcus pfennigii]